MKFETIGNATLIVYEKDKPILSTDVWFDEDDAYYGSWRTSHIIPAQQKENILKCPYIFISHFHPDHLNLKSLRKLKSSTILLGEHYKGRVEKDLRKLGFNVISLPPRKWITISNNIRIMLFCNHLQDTGLLIEITDNIGHKSLLLNINDSAGIGFKKEVSMISKNYKYSFYLALHGYGDADMINLYDFQKRKIIPKAALKLPVGKDIQKSMKIFNANIAIPFSSHHQYQRSDSFWANKYTTPLDAYSCGFKQAQGQLLLNSFQSIQLFNGKYISEDINPEKLMIEKPIHESKFGDNWSDTLTASNLIECRDYFNNIDTLKRNFNEISLSVGGEEHKVLRGNGAKAKLIFKVPKSSLMKSIRNETFDDLLIGNYMETYIKNMESLYAPDFTLSVSKYSDNGSSRTADELKNYFAYYASNRSIPDNALFLRNQYINLLPTRIKNILIKIRNMI